MLMMASYPGSNKSPLLPPGSVLPVNTTRSRGTKYLLKPGILEQQIESQTQGPGLWLSPPVSSSGPVTRCIKIVPPAGPKKGSKAGEPNKKNKEKILLTQQNAESAKEAAREKENSEELHNVEAAEEEVGENLLLPYFPRKKRKRKRKKKDRDIELPMYGSGCNELTMDIESEPNEYKKQKTREPSYHESKDTKGINKSTKHIPECQARHSDPGAESVKRNHPVSSTSKQKDTVDEVVLTSSSQSSESLSGSNQGSIVLSSDTPQESQSSMSEQSTGTQTQAIFQNKDYQGCSTESSPEVFVYCSDSDSDDPKALCKSIAKITKQNAKGKKNESREAHELHQLNKESKESPKKAEHNIVTVNIDEDSSPEPHLPVEEKTKGKLSTEKSIDIGDIKTPKVRSHSNRLMKKITKANLSTPSQPLQSFPEISPCSEAEVSPQLPLFQANGFMTPRTRSKLTKLSLSQKKKMSDEVIPEDSGSPAFHRSKKKLNQQFAEHNTSEGFEVLQPLSSSIPLKKNKVRFHDDRSDVPKLVFNELDDVSSLSLLGTMPESENVTETNSGAKEVSSLETFQPGHTSTQVDVENNTCIQESIKQSKKQKQNSPTIIPETSESSVSSSEQVNLEGKKEDKTMNRNTRSQNKELRSTSKSQKLSTSPLREEGVKALCDSTSTEDSQVKNSSESSEFSRASENPSTDSSASTEMLRPVGKTCLQSVAYVLQTHFGGTLTESFNVLHRNSFNLLTSIMELQALHPEVEDAFFGDEEDEKPASE